MKMGQLTSGRVLPIGVGVLAFALTACGGGSTPGAQSKDSPKKSAPAAGDKPAAKGSGDGLCKLVSQDEAEKVLGQPLTKGVSTSGQTPAGLSGGCKYLGPTINPTTSSKGIVQVIILGTKLTRAQYDELALSEGKIGAEAEAKAVPGLGETAFYVPGAIVTLFDHGLVMSVQVVRADRKPVDQAVVVALAHKALDRAGDLR